MTYLPLAPDVQDALDAALLAALPADTPRSIGYPVGGYQAPDHVVIAAGFDDEITREISGGAQRDEAGTVLVHVIKTLTTEDVLEVRDGARVLAGYVESAISADPTLGGAVKRSRVARHTGREAFPDEGTRQFGIELAIEYTGTVPR